MGGERESLTDAGEAFRLESPWRFCLTKAGDAALSGSQWSDLAEGKCFACLLAAPIFQWAGG